jgi:hypothetical protein
VNHKARPTASGANGPEAALSRVEISQRSKRPELYRRLSARQQRQDHGDDSLGRPSALSRKRPAPAKPVFTRSLCRTRDLLAWV